MCLLNKDVVEKNFSKEFKNSKLKILKKFLLNEEQKKSLSFIRKIGNNYNVVVLKGVTGSGKTLIYFNRIKDFLDKGKQALIYFQKLHLQINLVEDLKNFLEQSLQFGIQKLQKK